MQSEGSQSNELPTAKPKRRLRYRGTHPRHFHEKYKELNAERYAADLQKVIASGKTPAGMHRPICVQEILQVLAPKPGDLAVDATLGHGGHARALLEAILPGGRLLATDVDPIELPKTEARLRALGFPTEALVVRRTNFAGLPKLLASEGVNGADVILADLGVSSMQLDDPARGFTCKHEGPLDLRLNPERGISAADLLAGLSETAFADLLRENADEPRANAIAHGVLAEHRRQPIRTTLALARSIRAVLEHRTARGGSDEVENAVRRVFQALRIAVNDEFGALEAFLRNLPSCLKPGGRVAILTFHSGEDRRVKQAFQAGERNGLFSRVARDVIRPGPEEIRSNPRASSAKLRWAVRAGSTHQPAFGGPSFAQPSNLSGLTSGPRATRLSEVHGHDASPNEETAPVPAPTGPALKSTAETS